MNGIEFVYPGWLWALALMPLLGLLAWRAERKTAAALSKLLAPRLREALLRSASPAARRAQVALQLLAVAAAIFALARPIAGYETREVETRGSDILFAVDTSRSMLAADVAPDRLARARLVALDLLRLLPGDRVGLVAFAGSAFLQAPLTADHTAVQSTVTELDAGIIPTGGSDIGAAIRVAEDAFGNAEGQSRALVIFTDGEDLGANGVAEAKKAAEKGIRIYTVGVGTPGGSVIQLRNASGKPEFVKDQQGNPVRSRLDSSTLTEVAKAGGGLYYELSPGADIAPALASELGGLSKTAGESQKLSVPIDRFQVPLAISVGLLLCSLLINPRRRVASAVPVGALAALALMWCPPARAEEPDAYALYKEGKFGEAESEFQKRAADDPVAAYNAGTAAYAAGKYEDAIKSLGEAVALAGTDRLRADALYNLGNSLYRQASGRKETKEAIDDLKGAVKNYEQVLKLEEGNEPAKKNLEVSKKMIEELEKLQKQQEEQKKKDEQQKQGGEKDKKQEGQQGGKDDKKKEGDQQGEQQQKDGEKGNQSDQEGKGGQSGKEQNEKGEKDEQQKNESAGGDKKEEKQQGGKPEGEDSQGGDQRASDPSDSKQGGESGEKETLQPDRQREGEVGRAEEAGEKGQTPEEQAAEVAAEEARAIDAGTMTEQQARAFLRSLEAEDQKVRLLNPNEQRRRQPVIKDW